MTGMPKRLLLLLPLLLAALPPGAATATANPETELKSSQHTKIGKLMGECIEAYIARKGRRDAEVSLRETIEKKWGKAVKGRNPLSLTEDLGAALYHSRNYSKAKGVRKGKVYEFEVAVPFYGEDYKAKYELWAPSKYNQKNGPFPLIICLPGGSESPAQHLEKRWISPEVRASAILVSVHLPEKQENWAGMGLRGDARNAGGIVIMLSVFRDVLERYAIDVDRVHLVGEGTGGVDAAMRIANSFPDRFATVIGISGDAAEISPDNFANLPVFFAGGGSKATAFAKQAEEAGQAEVRISPEAKEADLWGWIQENRRHSNPEEVVLKAGSPFPNKAYWIEIPPRADAQAARLVASCDRASNTIRIETEGGIDSVTLYFNDLLVDLDKPVKVILNGFETESLIQRNFNAMMEQIYKGRSDPGKFYTAFKQFDIPEPGGEKEVKEEQSESQ